MTWRIDMWLHAVGTMDWTTVATRASRLHSQILCKKALDLTPLFPTAVLALQLHGHPRHINKITFVGGGKLAVALPTWSIVVNYGPNLSSETGQARITLILLNIYLRDPWKSETMLQFNCGSKCQSGYVWRFAAGFAGETMNISMEKSHTVKLHQGTCEARCSICCRQQCMKRETLCRNCNKERAHLADMGINWWQAITSTAAESVLIIRLPHFFCRKVTADRWLKEAMHLVMRLGPRKMRHRPCQMGNHEVWLTRTSHDLPNEM